MKKRMLMLACALLLVAARAEQAAYYTNNADCYYHADPDCDRPPVRESAYEHRTRYPRRAYQKYEISEEAALAFEKRPCPVCALDYAPAYLGEFPPEWPFAATPWGSSRMPGKTAGDEARARLDSPPEAYVRETEETKARFDARHVETFNREARRLEVNLPYPDAFGGWFRNRAGGFSYAFTDPGAAREAMFREAFGGGGWIVPAKYGFNEMTEAAFDLYERMRAWDRAQGAEVDVWVRGVGLLSPYEGVIIEISGADWLRAVEAFEPDAPIYVHFDCVEEVEE